MSRINNLVCYHCLLRLSSDVAENGEVRVLACQRCATQERKAKEAWEEGYQRGLEEGRARVRHALGL